MAMEMEKFEFPDDDDEVKDEEIEVNVEGDDVEVVVEDDTPPEDRNVEPLPEEIKEELDIELDDFTKANLEYLDMSIAEIVAEELAAIDTDSKIAQLPCGRIYSQDFLNVIPAIAEGLGSEVKVAVVIPEDSERQNIPIVLDNVIVARSVQEAAEKLSEGKQLVSIKYITTKEEEVPAGVELVIIAEKVVAYLGAIEDLPEQLDMLQRAIAEIISNA